MTLTSSPPLGLKTPKPKRNPAHMARVAQLPCVICGRRPVQVHHCIFGRFSQIRSPDEMTIPLCPSCHSELHANKAAWGEKYGPDYEFLPVVQDMLAGEWNG